MCEEKKDTKVEIAKIGATQVAGIIWIGKGIAIAGLWIGLGLSEGNNTSYISYIRNYNNADCSRYGKHN